MASLARTVRLMFDRIAKSEMILEEAKKKDSGIVVLQHNKQTGDLAYVRLHPKSKDHVVYSSHIEGESGEVILHRKHVKEMLALLDPKEKEQK
jgi:hypothetical protein